MTIVLCACVVLWCIMYAVLFFFYACCFFYLYCKEIKCGNQAFVVCCLKIAMFFVWAIYLWCIAIKVLNAWYFVVLWITFHQNCMFQNPNGASICYKKKCYELMFVWLKWLLKGLNECNLEIKSGNEIGYKFVCHTKFYELFWNWQRKSGMVQ